MGRPTDGDYLKEQLNTAYGNAARVFNEAEVALQRAREEVVTLKEKRTKALEWKQKIEAAYENITGERP